MVGLRGMGRAAPNDRTAQGSFGGIIGWGDTRNGNKVPEGSIQDKQVTTGLCRAGSVASRTLGEPKPDLKLDGRKFDQEGSIRQGAVADARPQD